VSLEEVFSYREDADDEARRKPGMRRT